MATTTYRQPKSVPINGNSGYPNNVANTQTLKIRGTGAATQGTNSSKKMGNFYIKFGNSNTHTFFFYTFLSIILNV